MATRAGCRVQDYGEAESFQDLDNSRFLDFQERGLSSASYNRAHSA